MQAHDLDYQLLCIGVVGQPSAFGDADAIASVVAAVVEVGEFAGGDGGEEEVLGLCGGAGGEMGETLVDDLAGVGEGGVFVGLEG